MVKPFNHPEVVVQSWYVVARSRELGRGQVLSRRLLDRPIALYRGHGGGVRALDGRCAHLGADLGGGTVVGDHLRCPFHHWTYAGDGRCVAIPYRDRIPAFAATFSYPVEEKYGAVWIFNGPRPRFPLPSFDGRQEEDLVTAHLPPQELPCHPHIVAANGLDVQHFKTVHLLEFAEEPVVEEPDEFRVRIHLVLRLRGHNVFEKLLRPIAGETVTATVTTWGGNLATIDGKVGPVPILVLFSHRPLSGSGSASQTFFFLPRPSGPARWLGLAKLMMLVVKLVMGYVLIGDRDILDTIRFRTHLVEEDAPLAAFIHQVNRMEVFDASALAWE